MREPTVKKGEPKEVVLSREFIAMENIDEEIESLIYFLSPNEITVDTSQMIISIREHIIRQFEHNNIASREEIIDFFQEGEEEESDESLDVEEAALDGMDDLETDQRH
jgi:hypothetical protein